MQKILSKNAIVRRAIIYQVIGYGVLLFLITGNEILDIPHNLFGVPATPINWAESLIEGIFIASMAFFTIGLTRHFLGRIRLLEGYLSICTNCKKIRNGEDWIPLEEYMIDHSEALFSHGLCPVCFEKFCGKSPLNSGSSGTGS